MEVNGHIVRLVLCISRGCLLCGEDVREKRKKWFYVPSPARDVNASYRVAQHTTFSSHIISF